MQDEIVRVNDKQVVAVEWNGERVVTTAQLAGIYEATDAQIKQNYGNNEARFKEGVHFYLLRGEELRAFKNMVEDFDLVGKNANQLYLWTRAEEQVVTVKCLELIKHGSSLMHWKKIITTQKYDSLICQNYHQNCRCFRRSSIL